MLTDTGLRLSELAGIELHDLDLEGSTITVWGKGAKQRIVRYGPTTADLLDLWLKERPSVQTLLPLTARGIASMLNRLQTRTGIKCNAHAFRRTFATESVRNGLNVFYVQSLLGHSSLTMTRIYAEQVSSEDAIKAYKPIVTGESEEQEIA
jgi:integrase/recombinase XerC/integrase/recombinase XerD